MDTLPDDLFILIANHDLPTTRSISPSNKCVQVLIDKYMKSGFERALKNLRQVISPELLEIIIQYNITIIGSFVLKSITNQDWCGNIDLVAKQDLPEDVKIRLRLKNKYNARYYKCIRSVNCIYSNEVATFGTPNTTKIDLTILKSDYNVNDLLEEYDFDFVMNSLEFLPNGCHRLTIKRPEAIWNKKCCVDVYNYGIMDAKSPETMGFRFSILMSRVKKYRSRGYTIKCDNRSLSDLILWLSMSYNGKRIAMEYIERYISTNNIQLSHLYALFDT